MNTKVKIVFILYSEYCQKWEDYFCIPELLPIYDIEYWDCSHIVDYGLHVQNRIDRPFVHIFKTLDEFEGKLKELPTDALINIDVFRTPKNYRFFKILSSYFRHIIFVEFHSNDTVWRGLEPKKHLSHKKTATSKIKSYLYKSDICRVLIKSIFHPKMCKPLVMDYFKKKEDNLFVRHIISAEPFSKMKINHPDVNKVFFQRNTIENSENGMYILYIDENFPYHPEIEKQHPDVDINRLAPSHFEVLNRFFKYVEDKYKCPVIIAAHPSSDYSNNPFDGRKVIYSQTESLVANSYATCLHSSTAVVFAMLYNKPIMVLIDDAIRKIKNRYIATNNTIRICGEHFVDLENKAYDVQFKLVPEENKIAYFQRYFGDTDLNPQVSNTELFKKYYDQIYAEINKVD